MFAARASSPASSSTAKVTNDPPPCQRVHHPGQDCGGEQREGGHRPAIADPARRGYAASAITTRRRAVRRSGTAPKQSFTASVIVTPDRCGTSQRPPASSRRALRNTGARPTGGMYSARSPPLHPEQGRREQPADLPRRVGLALPERRALDMRPKADAVRRDDQHPAIVLHHPATPRAASGARSRRPPGRGPARCGPCTDRETAAAPRRRCSPAPWCNRRAPARRRCSGRPGRASGRDREWHSPDRVPTGRAGRARAGSAGRAAASPPRHPWPCRRIPPSPRHRSHIARLYHGPAAARDHALGEDPGEVCARRRQGRPPWRPGRHSRPAAQPTGHPGRRPGAALRPPCRRTVRRRRQVRTR